MIIWHPISFHSKLSNFKIRELTQGGKVAVTHAKTEQNKTSHDYFLFWTWIREFWGDDILLFVQWNGERCVVVNRFLGQFNDWKGSLAVVNVSCLNGGSRNFIYHSITSTVRLWSSSEKWFSIWFVWHIFLYHLLMTHRIWNILVTALSINRRLVNVISVWSVAKNHGIQPCTIYHACHSG